MTTLKSAETLRLLRDVLSEHLDLEMADCGFRRNARSTIYTRKIEEGAQYLDLYLEHRPSSEPGAAARLYPYVAINFPQVNEMMCTMTAASSPPGAIAAKTLNQPMDFVIPLEHHERWYVRDRDSLRTCVKSMRTSVRQWTLPFFDSLTSIEAFTAAYSQEDARIAWLDPIVIRVAAAFLLLKRPDKADEVLQKRFSRPGPRDRYSEAFKFVAARMGETS